MSKELLTAARLRELLHYNPETGAFVNRVRRGRIAAGTPAGSPHCCGYIQIQVDGYNYLAHRLAWLWMTGKWPADGIDHRDLNRSNNRWDNLRPGNRSQNNTNCRAHRDSKSGIKGVRQHRTGRWEARVCANRVTIYLGLFDTPEEASAAYFAKARELHGEYARAA